MSVFARKLTWGGKLAILNWVLWVILLAFLHVSDRDALAGWVFGISAFILGFPGILVIDSFLPPTPDGTVVACVVIGANGLVWGYGLAWLFRFPDRRRLNREKMGLCPECGYDLRASPERCPECGTLRGTIRRSMPSKESE